MKRDKIRVVICDDMLEQREQLIRLCRKMGKKKQIELGLKIYDNGNTLLFDLCEPKFYNRIDILLLDINIPSTDGIQIAQEARRLGFTGIIIFATKSKEYFEDAFDVKALNYLVKDGRIEERFESVFEQALVAVEQLHQEVIVLSGPTGFKQIDIKDILYFEVANRIITVHYKERETFAFISTFQKLENQLFDKGFQRIHRAYLVNIYAIKTISYNEVTIKTGEELPVGRRYYAKLKEEMESLKL